MSALATARPQPPAGSATSPVQPDAYGWTAEVSLTCALLGPPVRDILSRLGARRVLDAGCGNGALCGLLAAAGHQMVGIDRDRRGIEIARESVPGVPFECCGLDGDPAEVQALSPAFDAVVSTEVVEHLYAPHELPLFAARVLAPGGHLVVSTPYHGYWKNLALSLLNKWDHHHTALWHGGHVKFWSRRTLSRLLAEHGFEVVDFRGVGRVPWLWMSMILVARKRPGEPGAPAA